MWDFNLEATGSHASQHVEGVRMQCESIRKAERDADRMGLTPSEPIMPGFLRPKGDHCLDSARSSQSFFSSRSQYVLVGLLSQ